MDLLHSFTILDPKNLPNSESQSLQDYDEQELEVLIDHYGKSKSVGDSTIDPMIDGISMKQEWQYFKVLVARNYPNVDISALWQLLITKHKDEIPNLAKLANICLLLPVSTACCERGFSTLNRTKTKLRNRLKTETLDTLMRIDLEGPPIENFNFAAVLSAFRSQKEHRIF